MTAQPREVLYYSGKIYWLPTEPLKPLLDIIGNEEPKFSSSEVEFISTACRRGYIGEWEIVEDIFFLIGLRLFNPDEMNHLPGSIKRSDHPPTLFPFCPTD